MSQSNSQNIQSLTGYASAAIARRRFVRFTAAGFVATQLGAATEVADGVATDAQATVGAALEIQTHGIVLMEAGGVITAPGPVTSDANGKAIAATAGDVVHGKALTTTAADAEMVAVLLKTGNVPAVAETTIAALTVSDAVALAAADSTIADSLTSVAPAAVAAYAAVVNMTNPVTKAEGEAVSAALATLRDSVEAQRAIIATLVTDMTTANQNMADLAVKQNAFRDALRSQGIVA